MNVVLQSVRTFITTCSTTPIDLLIQMSHDSIPFQMVSHNMSTPDGSTQHTQKKQMEILQARTVSGSLQVVRAETVQTTSSRWSSSTLHSEISNGISTSSGNSGSSYNGHSHSTISNASHHGTSSFATNGFSSQHLQQQQHHQFHRPLINSSRLLVSSDFNLQTEAVSRFW